MWYFSPVGSSKIKLLSNYVSIVNLPVTVPPDNGRYGCVWSAVAKSEACKLSTVSALPPFAGSEVGISDASILRLSRSVNADAMILSKVSCSVFSKKSEEEYPPTVSEFPPVATAVIVISAEPSNATPLIFTVFLSLFAVPAFPVILPLITSEKVLTPVIV